MTRRGGRFTPYFLGLTLAACGGPEPAPEGNQPCVDESCAASPTSVCPFCEPNPGGETTDFGTSEECSLHLEKTPLDLTLPPDLGFDLNAIVRAVESAVDAPLTWTLPDAGPTLAGYLTPTRVQMQTRVRSANLWRLSEACQAVACCEWGAPLGEVLFEVELAITTLDGAITTMVTGEAAYDLAAPEADFGLIRAGQLDLANVSGGLRVGAWPEAQPYRGDLRVFSRKDQGTAWVELCVEVHANERTLVVLSGVTK